MGMSGVRVYECKKSYNPKDHYYGIVWRDKERWAVPYPWDANKNVLYQVGLSLRYKAAAEEQFEKTMRYHELAEAEKQRDDESDKDQMVKECRRTLIDKPLYFYNK